MPIVSSVIVEDRAQRDGRRRIREQHTDHLGKVIPFTYLAAAGFDATAAMNARVVAIQNDQRDAEITVNIARARLGSSAFTFDYSTLAQNLVALRADFQTATGQTAAGLAKSVLGFNLSDAQYTTRFGVSGVQLTDLKTRLANMAGKFDDINAQAGQ